MSEIPRDHKFYDTNEQRRLLMELREIGINVPTYSVYEIEETPEVFKIFINEETPTIELKKELIEIIKLGENKEENYVYVISVNDFKTRIYALSGIYREFKDAKEHRFDGFNGDIRLIRSKILDSINKWIYLIELTTIDVGKSKYLVKIEKMLLK